MKQFYKIRGFNLIELIVVIAIIAVLTALSIVSFSSLAANRLTSDARKIVNDLCWARQMAVAKHRNHIAVFNTTNESYALYDDLNANGSPDANEEIKRRVLNTGIDLVSVIPSSQPSFFYPRGNASSTTNITLSSQGKTRTVQVFNNTGYVRIQ